MIAIQDFGFRRWEPGAATVVKMLIEPAVAIGTLLAAAASFGVPFAGSYVIPALLVFAMTFPGEPPSSRVPLPTRRLEYLRRWSPLFDLSIALKTVSVILSRKNAY